MGRRGRSTPRPRPAHRSPAEAQRARVGLPAGSTVWAGKPVQGPARLVLRIWDESGLRHHADLPLRDLHPQPGPPADWLDCEGLHDAETVAEVGRAYGLHPLAVEDVLNPATAIRVESYADHVFLTAQAPRIANVDSCHVEFDPLAFALGEGWLLTFRGTGCDPWGPVAARLEAGAVFLRARDVDHLLHGLLDAVADRFFEALRVLEAHADGLEESALGDAPPDLPHRVYALRAEYLALRRALVPLKEVLAGLRRGDDPRVHAATLPYFSDVYDHLQQALDSVEHGRDRLRFLLELYLATVNMRMNEVMKTLTVVGAIFIPLSFLAGVYGMNFDAMPELHWRGGYPLFWLLAIGLGGGMVLWMRRRGLI